MSEKVDLKVDFCSHEAAKWAVEHWHYSRVMPKSKLVKFGVWEDDRFIGVVIFGVGATYTIGEPYGLKQTEVCELVRVALSDHESPVTRVISLATKMLKRCNPGLRLIVSYADQKEGHLGIIYQAGNWVFSGDSFDNWIKVRGAIKHRRALSLAYGTNSLEWIKANIDPRAKRVEMPAKHKYLYPLDRAMRKQIESLSKPYPKRDNARLAEGSTPATSQGRGFDSHQAALVTRNIVNE